MKAKTTNIICYLTFIGWLIAFFFGDKKNSKFHLNQSLVIALGDLVVQVVLLIKGNNMTGPSMLVEIITTVLSILLFVGWVFGIGSAIQGKQKQAPLLGEIKIIK